MPTDGTSRPADAGQALDTLGRLALREHSMESLLQSVADLVTTVVPGTPEASVTVLVDGRASTVVYTGRLAVDCDESQYENGQGPCLHAAMTGELTEVIDARTETRWPVYARAAAGHGSLSSLSVPLPVGNRVKSALNIYARHPAAFDRDVRTLATRFAPYAAIAIAAMQAYQEARDRADNLQTALESRAVIDQAKGILIERYKLTPDEAFQVLSRASMRENRKVRDLAEHLVRTGEMPAVPPRR
jgi:GAF domain-containing protein